MILLVGFGYWGKNLARNFNNELVAVCDKEISRLNMAKKLYPNIEIFQDLDKALRHPQVQAILIATKANTHHEIAVQCLEANKDIWIEKPICENLTEARHLEHLAKERDKIIFVDHTFCYHPAVQKIKTIDIGKPIYYDSTRISLGLFQSDVDALLDLAIHDASIINYLYPNLQLKEKTIIKNYHVNDKANQVIVNLKFDNEFTATINCNWVSPVKKRQIILTGEKNSIVYDDIDLDKIKVYDTGNINTDYNANQVGDICIPKIETTEALANGRLHFLDCIKNRVQPITNVNQSLKIMEWLL